jgi:pyridinium-3,5-biscarboxylic acid mononucleotide sulfurtransferase
MNNNHVSGKLVVLKSLIGPMAPMAVAFSGGVDSTFLLWVAYEMHRNDVLAVVAKSPVFPVNEEERALQFLKGRGIPYIVIEPLLMDDAAFTRNHKDRCYVCKKTMFGHLLAKVREHGITTVVHGVNVDDFSDYRPGLKAASELGIVSPLADAGFTKQNVRDASRMMDLPTADLPSMACLASRIPYGQQITRDILMKIERSEAVLTSLSFSGFRARHHGELVRIEMPDQAFKKIMEPSIREKVVSELRSLGYLHVALDLEGYSQGSMNRSLSAGTP